MWWFLDAPTTALWKFGLDGGTSFCKNFFLSFTFFVKIRITWWKKFQRDKRFVQFVCYFWIAVVRIRWVLLYLQFQLQFHCLFNGLTLAPRTFTKILKPVFSALRKEDCSIMDYLDDTFLMGHIFNENTNAVLASSKLISNLWFLIHPDQSNCRLNMWYLHQSKNTALRKTKGNYDGMWVLEKTLQVELHVWEENLKSFNMIDHNVLPGIAMFFRQMFNWLLCYI